MNDKPKILVIGTGAIGSFYGGKLALGGADVSALCRSDYNVVKEKGISITSSMGDFHFAPIQVIKKIDDYTYIPDYIIITTKVLPEIIVSELIKDRVGKNTSIVLLQNGINIEEPVVKSFPENEIISALAYICATRIKSGIVDHQAFGHIVIGRYPQGSSEKIDILNKLFNKSGIKCKINNTIIRSRWEKLLWNAAFNPVSVLAGGVDTNEIIKSKKLTLVVEKVMQEILMLAEKSGYSLSVDTIQKNIENTGKMKPYKTSMLVDFENNRPMEVEAILGNTLTCAREYNVSIPYTESLYCLLSKLNENNII